MIVSEDRTRRGISGRDTTERSMRHYIDMKRRSMFKPVCSINQTTNMSSEEKVLYEIKNIFITESKLHYDYTSTPFNNFKKRMSLVFFGDHKLKKLCKQHNLDFEYVMNYLRQDSYVRTNLFDTHIFNKFYMKRVHGDTYFLIKHDDRANEYKISTPYDRNKGILSVKIKHEKSHSAIYDYSYDDPAKCCKCISCLKIKTMTPEFENELRDRMTDDPFLNIMHLEVMLFNALDHGSLQNHAEYTKYAIKNKFSAVSYINHTKSAHIMCGRDDCYNYFSKLFEPINNPLDDADPADELIKRYIPKNNKCKNTNYNLDEIRHMLTINIGSNNVRDESKINIAESWIKKNRTIFETFARRSTAPDSFGFSPDLLMYLAEGDKQLQTNILNMTHMMMMEMSNRVPDQWCIVDTFPSIKKEDGSRTDPSNFRLLTNHRIFLKYFHTHIAQNLHHYLLRNHLIDHKVQKAFKICEDGVKQSTQEFYSAQLKYCSQSTPLYALFLDIKNAYGSINHKFVKSVLLHYKVPTDIARYINTFYSKVMIRIHIDGDYTEYFRMHRGILQGDHLSNIIFLMCIGFVIDILKNKYQKYIPPKIKNMFSCFVDDILIYGMDPRVLKGIVEDFIKINKIFKTGFEISFEKSYVMMIGGSTKGSDDGSRDRIKNGIVISSGKTKHLLRVLKDNEIVKYLGSWIDSSSEYTRAYADHLFDELAADFKHADNELKQRNSLPWSLVRESDQGEDMINKNKFIVKRIFNYIISKVQWKISRLVMPIEKLNILITRLDNVSKHYASKWNTIFNPKKNNNRINTSLNVKNAIQVIINSTNPRFVKSVDDCVLEMYKKTNWSSSMIDNCMFASDYEKLTFLST
jgi:hypothetical protein